MGNDVIDRRVVKILHRSRYLLNAVRDQNEKTVSFLLKESVKTNYRDGETGNTPLHLAIQRDSYKIIELLLKHGADVNDVNDFGLQPLEMAFQLGRPSSHLLLLMKYGGWVNIGDFRNYSTRVDSSLVEPLYEYLDMNDRDVKGYNALHLATSRNHINGVRILLRRGAKENELTFNDDNNIFYKILKLI